jgi:branched-chain amino acid transport system substrate-binding protein
VKGKLAFAAVAVAALVAAGCGSSSSNTTSASTKSASTSASTKCTASIALEGPLTGPVSQLGLEQLHFAQLAVANDNAANHTNVSLAQDDTQLTPSLAVSKGESIVASNAVAVVGPAGSQEVEAVGPIFGKAGIAVISGSATLPALTTSGKNPTFFRVVPDDNIQGPQDANYAINHLHPKAVMLIDDDEAYSQGLVKVMVPVFQKAGVKTTHLTYNGTDTGATLSGVLSSLATKVSPDQTVVMLPWQTATNAQLFGLDLKQQGKTVTLFGTDGTNSPSQFKIPGSYVSAFGPDISTSSRPLDKSVVSGVAKYGPYGPFGVPMYAATDVAMKAIASVCHSGQTPSRSNVLAAVKKTNIPAADNVLNIPVAFDPDGNLAGNYGYLFKIGSSGAYSEIPTK